MIEKEAQLKSGAIELLTSWEVIFRPYKSSLEKIGGFEAMLTQVQDFLHCYAEEPTWRDEVQLAGCFDTEISLALDADEPALFAPKSAEAFQDWVMQTLGELGYEGWSIVNRVVTAMGPR